MMSGARFAGLVPFQLYRKSWRMSDSLLERIAAGDRNSVEECLTRYGGLVWSLAIRYIPNRAEAEEVVQDIFLDVWRNAGRFNIRVASELTFIAMIARRRLIDFRRKRQRAVATIPITSEIDREESAGTDSFFTGDEIGRAREYLTQLRSMERQVLEMAIDKGLSHSQIAEELGVPLGTVKTNARRGLIRLRELFFQTPPNQNAGGNNRE